MLDTKGPAKTAIDAMAKQNVYIGRIWPVWPTYARITIGTAAEMEQFQTAWQKVMTGARDGQRGTMPRRGELAVRAEARWHRNGLAWSRDLFPPGTTEPRLHTSPRATRYHLLMPKKTCRLRQACEPFVKLSTAEHSSADAASWVYRSDIVESAVGSKSPAPGSVVRVLDPRANSWAARFNSSSSQIAIRMISHGSVDDLPALVAERIRAAHRLSQGTCLRYRRLPHRFQRSRFLPRPHRRPLLTT